MHYHSNEEIFKKSLTQVIASQRFPYIYNHKNPKSLCLDVVT